MGSPGKTQPLHAKFEQLVSRFLNGEILRLKQVVSLWHRSVSQWSCRMAEICVKKQIFQRFQLRHPSTRLHSDADYIIASNLPRCNIVSIGVSFAHRIEE